MKYKLERLSRESVCRGRALEYMHDTVCLPDGQVQTWDFIHHRKGGGACVVPLLPDGRILMIRQWRPAIGRETLELPAGARDAEDEDGSVTATRELEEETGYSCETMERLAVIDTAVAWCDEQTEIYLAKGLKAKGKQKLDEAEEIRVVPCSFSELYEGICSGRIRDAKTVAGLLAYGARQHVF